MARALLWFRRDLRIDDHPALAAAAAHGEVVPLFVIDPRLVAASGAPRLAYLRAALDGLAAALGGALVQRVGDPAEVVTGLARELDVDTVFVSRDFGPYGRRRDAAVAERLAADGRALRGIGSPYAVEPGRVTKADGTPYAVFTPYSRTWLGAAVAAGALEGAADTPTVGSVDWTGPGGAGSAMLDPGPCSLELPPTTSDGAREQWERFHGAGLDSYDARRDLPAVEGTSRLSAALRWGVVHPRTLLADLRPERAHEVFRSELIWREFYADVLYRRPETAWRNLQASMDAMPVDTDAAAHHRFAAWCAGRTGFPIVDAGMRQLLATGWMHNRVRMIVASFLVKDLHLPWQWGARHFMDHLVDGDLASNNHGWQWAAGTGTDAAPYFRVFNPTSQSERFDPAGDYIRRWVPELAELPAAEIHQPGPLRRGAYPAPMVDHAAERDEALRRYRSLRDKTG